MLRHTLFLAFVLSLLHLTACQLDAEIYRNAPLARQQDTTTPKPTRLPAQTASPTPTPSPLPTSTATPKPTSTPSPTPAASARLVTARQAYNSGDYERARSEFDRILDDPGADNDERRVALHWRGRSELKLDEAADAIASFEAFLQQYPGQELARSAQFNLGRAYEQTDQLEAAEDAYLSSIVPDDPVNVYIYERIGDIRLQSGSYTNTVAAYQAGIDATEDAPLEGRLRERIAEAELVLNDSPAAAIAQYEAILNIATTDSYRARILRLIGETYLAMDDAESAYESYLESVNRYPEAYDSYLALIELVNAGIPVDEFQRGLVDYHAEAYIPAIAAFERYLAQAPPSETTEAAGEDSAAQAQEPQTETTDDSVSPTSAPKPLDRAAEATWFMALSMKGLGQYSTAIPALQQLIDNFPNSSRWSEAHLEIGKSLIAQGNYGRARTFLREFADDAPDDSLAPEALWRAAQLDLYEDLFEEAAASHRYLADTYPASEYSVDALYWAGHSAYKLEEFETAIDNWVKLIDTYPTSELVSCGGYWQAKALIELGRPDEAEAVLTKVAESPLHYCVLRARDLLTGRQPEPVPLKLPSDADLAAEREEAEAWLKQWSALPEDRDVTSDDLQSDQAFLRGAGLLELGLRDEALLEFEAVKDTWWNNALVLYQLSDYFKEQQLGRLSILTAARLIVLSPAQSPEDAPTYIQRLYYPIYFSDVIFREANRLDLDPAMLVALIRQESLFEKSAHSPAGARGLMQVMPATGEYVAERSGAEGFNTDQLWLPYVSIRFGSWYIDQQLGIFDDNQFAALAAYNAGPGNVLEWIKTSDDLDLFVESIPFWESRVYIRKIYANLAAYRQIYGLSSSEPAEDHGSSTSE